jgi:signal transduction histidine kinase
MRRFSVEPSLRRDPLAPIEQAAIAEELLSTIRHELRNKLATVRNATYYIRRRIAGSQVFAEEPKLGLFLDTMDNDVVAADAALIEGRAAEKLAPLMPKAARASAAECVEQAASLSRIEGARVRIEASVEPCEVDIDPLELAVAARCLIENAAEAMPEGGVVAVRGAMSGPLFVLEVADEGVGLPADARDEALQAFFTTKPGHAGLGLAMVCRIARRTGGRFTLKPQEKGAVATLSLPIARP